MALTDSTKRVYNQGAKAFQNFCYQYNLPTSFQDTTQHDREALLMYFAAYCANKLNVASTTINNYLYGIRSWQIGRGMADPLKTSFGQPLLCLDRVLKGIKKCKPGVTRPRLPITIDILRLLVSFVTLGCFGKPDDQMFIAAITMAFFGFLRCGEFTAFSASCFSSSKHLALKDAIFYPSFRNPSFMTLRFKYSKTDPFGKGHVVTLFCTPTGTCPVTAMQVYLSMRPYQPESPLLSLADGTPLTRTKFVMMLRTVLSKVGLNEDLYAGHSFRIGAATTAAVAGLPDYLIKALGRWSSDCYVRYVRTPRCSLEAAAVTLAGTSNIW